MNIDQRKIANIHDFFLDFDTMSSRLLELKSKFPSGLIIPIFGNDIRSPNLSKIISEINKCEYLSKVFIALSAKNLNDYEEAIRLSKNFKVPCEVAWCNKPEVLAVLEELKAKGLDVTNLSGKGKDVWIAIGIASLELFAFALHDADIVSYSKMIPTKLIYPIIEPKLDFFFAKGYYARINQREQKNVWAYPQIIYQPIAGSASRETALFEVLNILAVF